MGQPQPGNSSAVQNYTQQYAYDAVGNILSLQHVAGTGGYTRSYNIDAGSNRLLGTTVGSNTYGYTHDARGNMLTMPHLQNMGWNALNELYTITQGTTVASYQYSGGQRIRKYVDKGSIKEERIYLGSYEIYRKFDHTGSLTIERTTVHVSDDTGRIAMLETRTQGSAGDDNNTAETLARYIYSNHLQSAALELDANAAIISYEEYHPYGTTAYQANNAAINAVAKRYRYTGKERDEESGLYYHGARYYIPWLAKWSACDPLESKYAGMSPYNYGFNNPVKWTDSTGMGPDDDSLTKFEEGERQTQAQFQAKLDEVANSKADAGFKTWFANIGLEGLVSYRDKLYKSKLDAYNTGIGIGLYGRDESGNVAVPYSIRERLWSEAINETVPGLKATWAAAKSGYNADSIVDFLNPFKHAEYMRNLALTVSNKEEGWNIIKATGIQVGLSWAFHLAGLKGFYATVEARELGLIERKMGNLMNPARAIGENEDILITQTQGLQSATNTKFSNIVEGVHGDAETKYLWTIDNRGVNVALEKTPMTTSRGNIVHTNISSKAYIGGEAWFESDNTVIINAGSGRFGDGARVSAARWEAAIDYWKHLGYKVKALPLGTR